MKEAVIFGAGNIGRGFIGQLFSESDYRVIFIDIDRGLLDALNARGRYTIRLVTNARTEEVTVGPVRAIHADDADAVKDALGRAEIGATAVGAGALKQIAPALAGGIEHRARADIDGPLNLIVCENLHGAAGILRAMVQAALPAESRAYLAERVGFIDTVIARMVPPPTPALRAEDPSLIVVEPYKELPVDRDGFVGQPPPIVGMVPFAPFAFFTDRKLYIHNAGHAVLGYLGYLAGYEYGSEALSDDEIYFQARGAMEESALALTRKYRPAPGALRAHIDDLLERFGNRVLGDTTLRLGRDPARKLARSDRLVGAARTALEQGVTPVHLVTGILAALRFDHPGDPLARAVQDLRREGGVERVLAEVCGLTPADPLWGMILTRCVEGGPRTAHRVATRP